MIRKIHRMTSFGVFNDFTWPANLHDFKQFNLLFGWNYSGKTTFSRAFRCFELVMRHADFSSAEVHLHCEDGAVHMLSTTSGPHHYRVFNVDFVRENLRFDEGSAEPILILGATDIARQDELKAKQTELALLRAEIEKTSQTRIGIEAALDRALTAAARDNIKNPLRKLNYDKSKFVIKVDACKTNPTDYILNDSDYDDAINTYNSTDKKPVVSRVSTRTLSSLSSLIARVEEVCSRSVKSVAIQAVANDPELER